VIEPILIGASGTAAGGIIVHLYKEFRKEKEELHNWYTESMAKISYTSHIGQEATLYNNVDHETLADDLNEASGELIRHVETAPEEVDEKSTNIVNIVAHWSLLISVIADRREIGETLSIFNEIRNKAEQGDSTDPEFISNLVDSTGLEVPEDASIEDIDMELDGAEEVESEIEEFISIFPFDELDTGDEILDMIGPMTEVMEEVEAIDEGQIIDQALSIIVEQFIIEIVNESFLEHLRIQRDNI
jgi:hypothetical protein